MSFGKINLRLPKPGELKLCESQSTRSSNINDDDSTPSSNPFPLDPLVDRPKSLQPSESLKDCLKRTSEKLKNYSSLTSSINTCSSFSQPNEDFLKLQAKNEALERENNQLQVTNKILTDKLNKLEEIMRIDEDSEKLLKYAQFFVARVKRNKNYMKSFVDIFESEEKLLYEIKAEKLKKTAQDLLLFLLQNLEEKSESALNYRSLSGNRDSLQETGQDFVKIHKKSETLAQNISEQKMKIQQIYENLKFSMDRSSMVLSSRFGRQRNNLSCTPNELNLDFSVSRSLDRSRDFD